jgi:ATP-binding cassette, subfamily B, bacterial
LPQRSGNRKCTTCDVSPILTSKAAYHDHSPVGDLISTVTADIDSIQDFISQALLGILMNVLTLVGMLLVMFYLNWRFTLIAFSSVEES